MNYYAKAAEPVEASHIPNVTSSRGEENEDLNFKQLLHNLDYSHISQRQQERRNGTAVGQKLNSETPHKKAFDRSFSQENSRVLEWKHTCRVLDDIGAK
mmetsp:Transcript_21214/g.32871  ORF Transcript_21214/g.32871 Transcript_21214/m.32871 type:complete len:99 (-) Transcript_21214:942-1238(-)